MDSETADRLIDRLETDNCSLKRQLRENSDRWQAKVDELNYKIRLLEKRVKP